MGLAAGQARLLSITARKSDCEFQSMRLSHQKIAMARELADLSNEYQNSLNQTKLIYDYYGSGDTSTPLTYGLMMEPSALNDYMPIMLTSSDGRVVLNNKLALAARAAGIPQEGLGTLPSEELRNRFILALSSEEVGIITPALAGRITDLPYSQGIGFGSGEIVVTHTEDINLTTLMERLKDSTNTIDINYDKLPRRQMYTNFDIHGEKIDESGVGITVGVGGTYYHNRWWHSKKSNPPYPMDNGATNFTSGLTIADFFGDKQYMLNYEGFNGEQSPVYGVSMMQNYLIDGGADGSQSFVDWLMEEFSSMLDIGGLSTTALEYAYKETINLITGGKDAEREFWNTSECTRDGQIANGAQKNALADRDKFDDWTSWTDKGGANDSNGQHVRDYLNASGTPTDSGEHAGSKDEEYQKDVVENSQHYMGFYFVNGASEGGNDGNDHTTAGISLNNIAKAFLTYFADVMNGTATTDECGNEIYNVQKGSISGNSLVNENSMFTVKLGTEVSSDDLGQAAFYNAMFNQICANGWVENGNVDDKDYLQQMLQNGMMFISRVKDDNYYYQGNYATDTYIKEISDESAIAYAEAKYNTQKAKLNSKEETIDLKMKNLDTEISSLTTEYDTVKNTISKNIEKSFKRYNA